MKPWAKPNFALISLSEEDVIKTSGVTYIVSGKGDSVDWSGMYQNK